MHSRLSRDAIDQQLAAKGWMKAPSGGDTAVSAIGKVTEHDTFETFYSGLWRGWAGMGTATTRCSNTFHRRPKDRGGVST